MLIEVVYQNISKRFQQLGNAFCYMDFMNRGGISLEDWNRGLDGFAIKILPKDAKLIFEYLVQKEAKEDVLMYKKHFQKLLDEKSFRNVDPFELQVFKEE